MKTWINFRSKRASSAFSFIIFALGLVLFVNSVVLGSFSSFHIGVYFGLGFAISIMFFSVTNGKFPKLKWLNRLILIGVSVIFISSGSLFVYGINDNATYTEDAAIVLGAGLIGDVITYTLAERLNSAVAYAQKNPTAKIIVTGGQGSNENITEAEAMERYLLRRGVSSDRIIKEGKATSTAENMTFSKEILDSMFKRKYKAVIITNHFHIYRSAEYAKKAGIDANHLHANLPWYTFYLNYLRECVAVFVLIFS